MRLEQWFYTIPLRLRSLFHRRQVEQELDDELRYHVERLVEQNVASGMSAEAARRAAMRAIGRLERRKDECRDAWGVTMLDHFVRDGAHAVRTLGRDIGFTLGVVLILGIGIGANAAVFTVVDSILFEPLPYPDADRLVVIQEVRPSRPRNGTTASVNPLHFREWQRECSCFDDVALSSSFESRHLTSAGGDPVRVQTSRVTPGLFSMIGVEAALGRTFALDDGEDDVVLISDGLWRSRFGADPDIVGRSIALDGVASVVLGVLPAGFRHPHSGLGSTRIDVFRPWAVEPQSWWNWDGNYTYPALARLRDGVSIEAAVAELNGIQSAIAERLEPDALSRGLRAQLVPLQQWMTAESRAGLLLLLGAAAAAFVVACVNIANLMLVRATSRSREAGVRSALGASRLAIFRGVLIESAVLAAAGAALGIVLAAAFLHFFDVFAPARLPRVDEVHVDWAVPLVGLILAVAATLAFGLLPAARMTRTDAQEALHASSRSFTESRERFRFRQSLISLEVALSACLLAVAGLLLTSFIRVNGVDRGYDSANVLTAEISLPQRYGNAYSENDAWRRFYESLVERMEGSPGVAAAGMTSVLPLRGQSWGSVVIPEGESQTADSPDIDYRFVSPGYFRAMGLPVLTGRSFEPQDHPRNVAVVSERVAGLLSPQENPIGKRFYRGNPEEIFQVVGVVPDVHSEDLASDPRPIVYVPHWVGGSPASTIAIRTVGDPASVTGALREAVRSLDPSLALSNVRTMEQIDAAALADRRFQLVLLGTFAVAALLVAALGVYGVLAYAVAGRTHEIAVRMALGAGQESVLAMVLHQGMRPVLLGLGIGLLGAVAVGQLLSSLLFSVAPTDAATLGSVAAVTLAAALLASWMPARRAARTSLLDALRYE